MAQGGVHADRCHQGRALIKKWGRSSGASTAVSIADALRSLYIPTEEGDCFSSAVCTDGNTYGIEEGLVFSMPCRSNGDGDYEIIDDFVIDEWLQMKLDKSQEELVGERSCVSHLIPEARRRSPPACDIKEDTMLPGEK